MSACLVIVEKTYNGQTWENTHAVGLGSDFTSRPSDTDLATLGAGSIINATNTASGGGTNFLQRLLSFERNCAFAATVISRVYMTDGKRNRLGNTEFFVATPNLAGLGTNPADLNTILPGNIALIVNRNPVGFSQRPGRMFLRGLLLDTEVSFGSARFVQWTSAAIAANYATSIANALSASGLLSHVYSGTNAANGVLLIPKYRRTKPVPARPNQEGELIGGAPIGGFTVGYPTGRQSTRGRKRSA